MSVGYLRLLRRKLKLMFIWKDGLWVEDSHGTVFQVHHMRLLRRLVVKEKVSFTKCRPNPIPN